MKINLNINSKIWEWYFIAIFFIWVIVAISCFINGSVAWGAYYVVLGSFMLVMHQFDRRSRKKYALWNLRFADDYKQLIIDIDKMLQDAKANPEGNLAYIHDLEGHRKDVIKNLKKIEEK